MTTHSSSRNIEREFDIYDQEFAQDPHAVWQDLRSGCPVSHSSALGGFWTVTRYEDVLDAARDTARYSSRSNTVPRDLGGSGFAERPPITMDPPRHTAFRRLLVPGFSVRESVRWKPELQRLAREAIDAVREAGECDAADHYAKALPVGVMCALLGIPAEMVPSFERWVYQILVHGDPEQSAAAVTEVRGYFDKEVRGRADAPGDDLITLLMTSEVDGEKLTHEDLVGALVVIFLAALDTTWGVLGNAMVHLATHPEDRARLVAEPELIPRAVEEFLRYFAPTPVARITTEDVEVGGIPIPADSSVLLSLPAANRDPDVFDRPEEIVIDRETNRHVAFGYGAHRCIGAPLARLELQVALEEWLAAIPEFELAVPASEIRYKTGHVWGPVSVPVRFPKSRAEEPEKTDR